MKIKKIISKSFSKFPIYQQYLGKRTDDIGYKNVIHDNKSNVKLSRYEKDLIKETWGEIIPSPLSIGYSFYEMVKVISEFSPSYLPSSYYMPYIFNALNLKSGLKVLGHKGLQRILFKECNQPDTVISRISGIFYDSAYNNISLHDAIKIIRNYGEDMIFKPAIDSSMGHGVKLITSDNINLDLINTSADFIIQKRVLQSPFMSELNDSSLNCMRLTSININGMVSIESRIIKIGAKGSVVDNIGGGSGGLVVGISKDGILADEGFRIDCSRIKSGDGIEFKNKKIPNFKDVLSLVTELHRLRNSMGIIGWDIALDSENNPVLIEANTYWPGITMEQFASGPIFGSRTKEVIEYIKSNCYSNKNIRFRHIPFNPLHKNSYITPAHGGGK